MDWDPRVLGRSHKGKPGTFLPCQMDLLLSVCLSFRVIAHNRFGLWKMGISHVLNAAHGMIFCKGSHGFYGPGIEYYGVPAYDLPNFDLSPYFYPAAEFIHKALSIPGGMETLLVTRADRTLGCLGSAPPPLESTHYPSFVKC